MRRKIAAMLGQRCPACLRGKVFRGRFTMNPACPSCRLVFEREPGYFVGAMYVSYALCVPLVTVLALVVHLILPDRDLMEVMILAALAACPFLPAVFRYSRVLWLHVDRGLDP